MPAELQDADVVVRLRNTSQSTGKDADEVKRLRYFEITAQRPHRWREVYLQARLCTSSGELWEIEQKESKRNLCFISVSVCRMQRFEEDPWRVS